MSEWIPPTVIDWVLLMGPLVTLVGVCRWSWRHRGEISDTDMNTEMGENNA